jgi:septum site-determining protein MinC
MSEAARPSPTDAPQTFELKNATLTLNALVLGTTDPEVLSDALEARFGETPLFDHDPVVLDLSQLPADAPPIDFEALAALLRRHRMLPAGVEGGTPEQHADALAAGLGETVTRRVASRPVATGAARSGPAPLAEAPRPVEAAAAANGSAAATPPAEALAAARSAEAVAAARDVETPAAARAPAPVAAGATRPTVVVDRPLRSGQQIYARGADLVVLAAVNFGAEVIADGHIHVYAPLRGRAIAGARGNVAARIFSTCMQPQLIAIAGTYRTVETPLPDDVHGRPAQVRLEGESIVVEPLES